MNARFYGRLQTAQRWSREEIDRKTMDEVDDLHGYWRQNPPEHEMLQIVAARLGWKPLAQSGSGAPSEPLSSEEMQVFSKFTYEEP